MVFVNKICIIAQNEAPQMTTSVGKKMKTNILDMKQLEIQKHITSLSSEEFSEFRSTLNMITLLTIDEELELIRRIRNGGNEAERAKEVLANSYLRFIYSVANQFKDQGLSLQELIVSGITGLIGAAEKYDETRGFKFASYAIWWIRESILKSIVKQKTSS